MLYSSVCSKQRKFFVIETLVQNQHLADQWSSGYSVCYLLNQLARVRFPSSQTEGNKNWFSASLLDFQQQKESVRTAKPQPCVVNRWAGGSLTRKSVRSLPSGLVKTW